MKFQLAARIVKLLLSLALCFLVLVLGVLLGFSIANPDTDPGVVASSTYAYQDYTGEQAIDLGILKAKQPFTYQLQLHEGDLDLWVEDSTGTRIPPTTVTYQFETPVTDAYFLQISGEEAAFQITTALHDP